MSVNFENLKKLRGWLAENDVHSDMEFEEQPGGIIAAYGFSQQRADYMLLGTIRPDNQGYYCFHPARRVVLSTGYLKRLATKMSELNKNT